MHLKCLILACVSSVCCYAQDWQSHYTSALQLYQQEDYGKAISEAEKAIGMASGDVKGQAYARQIFTAACLATEQYEKGLTQVSAELENFKALDPEGEQYLEALRKKGQLELGVGEFGKSADSFHQLAMLYAQRSGKQSYEFLIAQAEEANALMQAKKFEEAQRAFEESIAGFSAIPDAGEDYLYALFNSGFIDFNTSNKASASRKLSELIGFMETNGLQSYPEYQQAREMLSRLNVSGDVASTGLVLPEDQAKQLFDKAFELQGKNAAAALEHYKACAAVIAAHQLLNNTTFSCYLNYGRLLFAEGSFKQAGSMVAMARQHGEKLFGAASDEIGHVRVLLGDIALREGDTGGALAHYMDGIKYLREGKSDVWIRQVRWVAEQLVAARVGEQAIRALGVALADPMFQSLAVRDKVIIHQINGRAYIESLQSTKLVAFLKPLLAAEKDPDLKQTYLLLSGQATEGAGDLQGAHRYFLDALALAPGGMVVGEVYFESARAYQQLGDFRNAEIHYRKALELIVHAPLSEVVLPALFNSVATFYIQLGNYEAAENFFQGLLSKANGAPHFYNAVRQNLSALYQETGRYKEAKRLLQETIRVDEERGADEGDYAIALQNLAAVYQNLNQLDSARLLYEKALTLDARKYGERSLSFATKLANLGTVYQEGGDFASARRMFERAMEVRRALLPADHPDFAYSQYTLANLLYRTQKPQEALPLFDAAAETYLRQIHDVFPALSDYERTAFYNRVSEVIATYQMFILENIHLGKELPAKLLNFRLQTKALLLNSSLKVRKQILSSGDAALIRDFHMWQHTKEQLAYLFTLPKSEREEHAGLIKEYSEQANALEKSLSLKSDDFASTFTRTSQDWRSVQAALKPGESAVEIVRVKLKDRDSVVYGALVVKPGLTQPDIAIVPDGKLLEEKVYMGYMNRIQYELEDPTSYNVFWKKIGDLLGDAHTVYLSPDGVYTKINCGALYDADRKQYLIDRKKIMLVSNIRDLLDRQEERDVASHALLIGDPDYRMDSKGLSGVNRGASVGGSIFSSVFTESFVALPGTATEVTQVGTMLEKHRWKVETMMRGEALESKVKEGKNVALLHIATHGFFVAPRDEHSKQVYSTDLKDIEDNSMMRSGLILAEAEKNLLAMLSGAGKTEGEDGILTAYEVMNLNLDATDLVVLSACETAKGDVRNGEGVYGLQRAFLLAGARHVMMSLWKVDDQATQHLMAEFYAQWLGGKSKLEAFREAQLKMRVEYPHVRYWGAFVLVGR